MNIIILNGTITAHDIAFNIFDIVVIRSIVYVYFLCLILKLSKKTLYPFFCHKTFIQKKNLKRK